MDAITLLKNDHQTVAKLFKRFESAGPRAHVEKRAIVDRIVEELAVHAAIEEAHFYPAVRAAVDDLEETTLESLEEHHVVKRILSELTNMDPEHERFDAKVTVLIENVRHHVDEEQRELFPKVRRAMGRDDLEQLGRALEQTKKTAPRSPHPRLPDSPPGNLINPVIGLVENVASSVTTIAKEAIDFVNPLSVGGETAGTNGRSQSSESPKSAANSAKTGASQARAKVEKTARSAAKHTKSVGKPTRRKATSTVKRASKSGAQATKHASKRPRPTAKRTTRKSASRAKKATGSATRNRATPSTANRAVRKSATRAKKAAESASSRTATRTSKRTARPSANRAESAGRAPTKSAKSTALKQAKKRSSRSR